MAAAIRERRHTLTEAWVARLEHREDERYAFLPRLDLNDRIPVFLDRVAEYVANPSFPIDDTEVVESLGRLADLRRRLGFTVDQLLEEYRMLAAEVGRVVHEAAQSFEGEAELGDVVAASGRFRDAIQLLSSVTGGAYRAWTDRYEKERQNLFDTFGPLIEHELGNRLGAAETAIQLLQADLPVSDERRERLYELILESIRGGRQTIRDVGVLAQPLSSENEARSISLKLLVKEAVRMGQANATRTGVSIALTGEIPAVRVAGPPLRVALSNLLGNAVKYHRDSGDDRWVRVAASLDETASLVTLVVEDNGPGISDDTRARIFEYRYRGNVEPEGSGLGLAITRDALARIGGSITVHEGEAGGARFELNVPVVGAE